MICLKSNNRLEMNYENHDNENMNKKMANSDNENDEEDIECDMKKSNESMSSSGSSRSPSPQSHSSVSNEQSNANNELNACEVNVGMVKDETSEEVAVDKAQVEKDTETLLNDINYGTILAYIDKFGQYFNFKEMALFKNFESSLTNKKICKLFKMKLIFFLLVLIIIIIIIIF